VVSQHLLALEQVLSKPRLDAYEQPGGTELDRIVNYLWNIDLAEALVPSLHAIEAGLRNAIHNTLTKKTGTSLWFFQERLLRPAQLEDFVAAYDKVHKKPDPIDGLIVSQCMFGFWTAMLTSAYDEQVWKPDNYKALYEVFPGAVNANAGGRNVSRKEISDRITLINRFRNRVFHYEKIYEWQYIKDDPTKRVTRTANQDHVDIHEAIEWISPTLHQAIYAVDNFGTAWASRSQVEADLKARLGIS
jgi:hypothetical protein